MRGVREKSELGEFTISRRLTARLGALILKKIEVSHAVIEAAVPASALEKLLLSPTVLGELTPDLLKEAGASAGLGDEGLVLDLADSEDGWRIIALEEELLAEKAWGEDVESAAAGGPAPARPLARTRPAADGAGAAGLFDENRLKELKVTLFTSADPEAKIEALRLLCYSPLPPEEKAEVLLQGLQDVSAEVRAESAGLTALVGLDASAAENLRTMATGAEEDRAFASERLAVYAREGRGHAAMMAVTALVAALRNDPSAVVRRACLRSLEESAAFLASNTHRATELIRMLLAHLGKDYGTLATPARRLFVRLAELIPEVVSATIWEEVEATPDRRVRVMLLTVLGDIPGTDARRLAAAMAAESARSEERGADFRSFATYFHKLGVEAIRALVAVYPSADQSQRKYLVHLLDDICRYGQVTPEAKEEVALLFKRYLSGASRDIRISIMSTHVVSDRNLSDDTRRDLAGLFLENVHDVHMPTDIDNVEYTVSHMGMAAVDPLASRLGDHYPDGERVRSAKLLGELGRHEGFLALSEETGRTLEGLLRTLEKRRMEGFPETGAVLVAEGKIASSPSVGRNAVNIVTRAALEELERKGPDAFVYEALGWAASSTKAAPGFIKKALQALYAMLDAPEVDIVPESRLEGDTKVFELGDEAGFYTDLLPAAMKGLELVYLGHARASGLRNTIVGFLLRKWQEVITGKHVWGPGNVTEMVQVLKRIAAHSSTDSGHRLAVLKLLGKRLYNIPVMLAVGDILKADASSGEIARVASAVAVALLKRRDAEGRFNEDERTEILEVLGEIVSREHLDTETAGTDRLRDTLIETLFAGLRDSVPGVYQALSPLRSVDWLPEKVRQSIAERLADYESIVPYAPS
ncbi:MAG: hypothetical protein JW909_03325 [Planctomycetes bacterium]|nr:hypothetical protein [Planctomycetota bacterium]